LCSVSGTYAKLMLSSSFRCCQIHKRHKYDFGHTLLCFLSRTWMFNKPTSGSLLLDTALPGTPLSKSGLPVRCNRWPAGTRVSPCRFWDTRFSARRRRWTWPRPCTETSRFRCQCRRRCRNRGWGGRREASWQWTRRRRGRKVWSGRGPRWARLSRARSRRKVRPVVNVMRVIRKDLFPE